MQTTDLKEHETAPSTFTAVTTLLETLDHK